MDEYLVCFDKDALGENTPSEKTVMSKDHKLYYKGNMIEARQFVKKFDGVNKISYEGETLYNVVMEKHSVMNVNNLLCETLHPKNMIAKLYADRSLPAKYKDALIKKMNNSILFKNSQVSQKNNSYISHNK